MCYSNATAEGYCPDTVVYDLKTQFGANCEPWDTSSESPCYSPNNYNNQFKGPISLRNALAQSLNIPAVKVLYLTGIKDAIKLASDMGITTLDDPDRLGLTLVLGGGEVKLLEHTGAYAVLANEGVKTEQRSILRIEDNLGSVIEEFTPQSERVLDRDVALQITDVLADNTARAPLWGYNSQIYFPNRDVAAKSGSTNNLRDAWIMGYAPNLAVGAWVGNNDNSSMGGGLSGLITTPMWRAFMDVALPTIEEQYFPEAPATDPTIKPILRGSVVDATSLIQSTAMTGSSSIDIPSVTSGIHTILHFVNKSEPLGAYPTNPASDPQYRNWEYAVQKWKEVRFGSLLTPSTDEDSENNGDGDEDEDDNNSNNQNEQNENGNN